MRYETAANKALVEAEKALSVMRGPKRRLCEVYEAGSRALRALGECSLVLEGGCLADQQTAFEARLASDGLAVHTALRDRIASTIRYAAFRRSDANGRVSRPDVWRRIEPFLIDMSPFLDEDVYDELHDAVVGSDEDGPIITWGADGICRRAKMRLLAIGVKGFSGDEDGLSERLAWSGRLMDSCGNVWCESGDERPDVMLLQTARQGEQWTHERQQQVEDLVWEMCDEAVGLGDAEAMHAASVSVASYEKAQREIVPWFDAALSDATLAHAFEVLPESEMLIRSDLAGVDAMMTDQRSDDWSVPMSYDVSFEDVLAGEKESLYEALYAPVGESIEDEDLDSLYDAFDEQMEEPDSGAETSEEATPEVAEPSEPSLTPQEQRLYNAAAAAQPQGPQPTPKE